MALIGWISHWIVDSNIDQRQGIDSIIIVETEVQLHETILLDICIGIKLLRL